jgi:hypothetical protein
MNEIIFQKSVQFPCKQNKVIKFRGFRWVGHIAHIAEMENVYKILVGKPEGKKQLGRPMYRWEDNIKMDLWK